MQTDHKIKILLADDHSLIRNGLSFILEDLEMDFEEYTASNLNQVQDLLQANSIDFAIMDAHFPDGNSLKIIPQIRAQYPQLKLLIYSGIDEKANALKYINAGVNGFVSKLSEEEDVKDAIQKVLETGKYISGTVQELLFNSIQNPEILNPLGVLSNREREIAELYTSGLGNLEIANTLNIKQNTVSTLKKRIFEKLKVDNVIDLVEIFKSQE